VVDGAAQRGSHRVWRLPGALMGAIALVMDTTSILGGVVSAETGQPHRLGRSLVDLGDRDIVVAGEDPPADGGAPAAAGPAAGRVPDPEGVPGI
jgi:hypothetical protein